MSVPIVLMQCLSKSLLSGSFVGVDPPMALLDVAIASSIYSKDRSDASTASASETLAQTASMVGATTFLCQDVWTTPLAPLVPLLHYEYASRKREIARIKPLVVGAAWTCATYYLPVLAEHDQQALCGLAYPLSYVFLFASISHLADIPDVDEDRASLVYTPAVLIDDPVRSKALALALTACGVLAHNGVHMYDFLDLLYDASVALALVAQIEDRRNLLVLTTACALYLTDHYTPNMSINFISQILIASEPIHAFSIRLLPNFNNISAAWPPWLRAWVFDAIVRGISSGDSTGSRLVDFYVSLYRELYGIKSN